MSHYSTIFVHTHNYPLTTRLVNDLSTHHQTSGVFKNNSIKSNIRSESQALDNKLTLLPIS